MPILPRRDSSVVLRCSDDRRHLERHIIHSMNAFDRGDGGHWSCNGHKAGEKRDRNRKQGGSQSAPRQYWNQASWSRARAGLYIRRRRVLDTRPGAHRPESTGSLPGERAEPVTGMGSAVPAQLASSVCIHRAPFAASNCDGCCSRRHLSTLSAQAATCRTTGRDQRRQSFCGSSPGLTTPAPSTRLSLATSRAV